jgi:hypothetical protein
MGVVSGCLVRGESKGENLAPLKGANLADETDEDASTTCTASVDEAEEVMLDDGAQQAEDEEDGRLLLVKRWKRRRAVKCARRVQFDEVTVLLPFPPRCFAY